MILRKEEAINRFDIEVLVEGAESPIRDDIDEVLDYEYLHSSIESAISRAFSVGNLSCFDTGGGC